MIVELTVENLAIIERAQLCLGPGFTVLTGETGAGKSLLIDALELALGERADTELVRTGAKSAVVGVVFDLADRPALIERCAELGHSVEDGRLYVNREVFAEGRSQSRVAGKLVPVSALRQLGELLVDLHGQHDHQALLDAETHLSTLDQWIGPEAAGLSETVRRAYEAASQAKGRLAELRAGMRDREQRLDLLRFQVQEIESADPQPGELEELEGQLLRLKHLEKLHQAASVALTSCSDGEANAIDLLAGGLKALEGVARFDPQMEEVVAPLAEALVQLQEGVYGLRSYAEALDADPGRLDEVASRIDLLKRLRRKYGEDESRVLEFLDKSRAELELLEDSAAGEESLVEAVSQAQDSLDLAAGELSRLRQQHATKFADLVQAQLRDLAMDRAEFRVDFRERAADRTGMDDVEFYFTANAGESARPLVKIASGGEISRVMLALKSALAGRAGVPTLIFDEVDAGLGGRAAATMARKLEELATHYQVVVISHLPQIASRAAIQVRIEKSESDGRAATNLRELSQSERVEEIARMLAGDRVTSSALASAREMLTGKSVPSSLFD